MNYSDTSVFFFKEERKDSSHWCVTNNIMFEKHIIDLESIESVHMHIILSSIKISSIFLTTYIAQCIWIPIAWNMYMHLLSLNTSTSQTNYTKHPIYLHIHTHIYICLSHWKFIFHVSNHLHEIKILFIFHFHSISTSQTIYTKYPARRLSQNENPFYLPPFNLRVSDSITQNVSYTYIHTYIFLAENFSYLLLYLISSWCLALHTTIQPHLLRTIQSSLSFLFRIFTPSTFHFSTFRHTFRTVSPAPFLFRLLISPALLPLKRWESRQVSRL